MNQHTRPGHVGSSTARTSRPTPSITSRAAPHAADLFVELHPKDQKGGLLAWLEKAGEHGRFTFLEGNLSLTHVLEALQEPLVGLPWCPLIAHRAHELYAQSPALACQLTPVLRPASQYGAQTVTLFIVQAEPLGGMGQEPVTNLLLQPGALLLGRLRLAPVPALRHLRFSPYGQRRQRDE